MGILFKERTRIYENPTGMGGHTHFIVAIGSNIMYYLCLPSSDVSDEAKGDLGSNITTTSRLL